MTEEQIRSEANKIIEIVLNSEDDYEALEKIALLLRTLYVKYPNRVI
tara:strand:+ start:4099 stop:4239 length:141 start_codon:yes stop_codon:yes gene_type:complete